ncbi:hypothetical protein AGABI1DRAFT_95723, partial [Agaricus bisporus var. burnettii JB137-S8]
MPRKAKQQPAPASTPYPSCPPLQAPPPPAHPNAARLTVSDIETMLKPEYAITGLMNLANWSLDSHENRAIMDAVRNRGIAPAVAIANAEASALAKGNVKGPSGQPTGIGAAPPAVKTLPRAPSPPRVPTPLPPVPTRPPSTPRAPSPSASVLSSKRPISPGSSSSGPSVAAVSVCDSEDSSMALDYEDVATPRPASPADEEHLDSNESAEAVITLMNSAVDIFEALSASDWKQGLIEAFPTIMDDDINRVRSVFTKKISRLRSILSPAVVAPASAVDAPAPCVIPRDAPPPAESSKAKPPKKKVRVEPTPSDVTPPATAPLMEVDEPAAPLSASGKAPTTPLPIPSSKCAPPPSSAPSVSFRAPSAPRKRRQGKHTSHGASRRAIILKPPTDSPVTAASFTPEVINNLNQLLKKDVKSDVILTHASVEGNGICIAASRVPSPAEIAFVLKHVRRIFPSPNIPIAHSPITSTSYLKIVDIPHVPASSKEWASKQYEAFTNALNKSPVGASLAKLIKHKPRFMLELCQNVTASRCHICHRLNYRHTAKMAQATDLPIELIDLIFSFLPPNHAEQVQWRRAAAAIGREPRPTDWNLSGHQCRICGRMTLAMWDAEEGKAWVIQRWSAWGARYWEIAGFFIMCPCDALIGNYFGYY